MPPKSLRGGLVAADSNGSVATPRIEFNYEPKNSLQRKLRKAWPTASLIILDGPAGCGKTAAAMGEAMLELLRDDSPIRKIMVSRPPVPNGDRIGFLPGDLNDKLAPWLAPIGDALEGYSNASLSKLGSYIEPVDAGMLQGRTVRNAVCIIDEAQNCTYSQLKCFGSRVGHNGRVILCGDPTQSNIYDDPNPLALLAKMHRRTPGVAVITATKEDQLRSEFVTRFLDVCEAAEAEW